MRGKDPFLVERDKQATYKTVDFLGTTGATASVVLKSLTVTTLDSPVVTSVVALPSLRACVTTSVVTGRLGTGRIVVGFGSKLGEPVSDPLVDVTTMPVDPTESVDVVETQTTKVVVDREPAGTE
jgi:hypothetical protein